MPKESANRPMDETVADFIIGHLAEVDNPDDIILDVCQKFGFDWTHAKKLVRQVSEQRSGVIARKQLPVMYLTAFLIFVTGLLLLGGGLYSILESIVKQEGPFPPDLYYYLIQGLDKGNYPFSALQPAIYPYAKWLIGAFFSPITIILFGIVMILGSLYGMRDVWGKIIEN